MPTEGCFLCLDTFLSRAYLLLGSWAFFSSSYNFLKGKKKKQLKTQRGYDIPCLCQINKPNKYPPLRWCWRSFFRTSSKKALWNITDWFSNKSSSKITTQFHITEWKILWGNRKNFLALSKGVLLPNSFLLYFFNSSSTSCQEHAIINVDKMLVIFVKMNNELQYAWVKDPPCW